MFKIKKRPSPQQPLISAPHQDPAVPRFVSRQMLALMRATRHACLTMDEIYRAMPPEHRAPYEHLVGLELGPALLDIDRLTDVSEGQGLLSSSEVAALRLGRMIDNPVPKGDGGALG